VGLPLPQGAVPAGTEPVVAVAAVPSNPSNTVQVEMRRDGGRPHVVRALPEATPWQEGSQWFRAALPILDMGRRIDYRLELTRAGQRLATLPADGSWLTVTGDPAPPPRPAEPAAASEGVPRWGYELSFLAALTINLRAEVIGETPDGWRCNFFVVDGHVIGPRMNAVLRSEGGDWMCVRRDGIGLLNVRITYELSGGGLILEQCGGVFDLGPQGYADVVAGRFTGTPPLYATPTWSTAHPDWTWLNRCQGFEFGRVDMQRLQVQGDIYLPQVLGRLDG
jgi:hypothetical protein